MRTSTKPTQARLADIRANMERQFPDRCCVISVRDATDLLAALDERPAPVGASPVETSAVVAEIAAERRRQIEAKGWTPEHDDGHDNGELADAAAVYAFEAGGNGNMFTLWPWSAEYFKSDTYRRMLIKAAALIVAEIERLDRASTQNDVAGVMPAPHPSTSNDE